MLKNESGPVKREEKIQVDEQGEYRRQMRIIDDEDARRRTNVGRVASLVWVLLGILEAFIGLRILLKLIAANPSNPVANLVYSVSEVFLWPFRGLTTTPSFENIVLDIPAIIALFVYALVGWVIVRLVWLLFYHPGGKHVRTVEYEKGKNPD